APAARPAAGAGAARRARTRCRTRARSPVRTPWPSASSVLLVPFLRGFSRLPPPCCAAGPRTMESVGIFGGGFSLPPGGPGTVAPGQFRRDDGRPALRRVDDEQPV